MPAKKSTAATKKVMDVSHPNTTKADATGVPLIVTNRPILRDPMVMAAAEEPAPIAPAEAPKTAKKAEPIIQKITLAPLPGEQPETPEDATAETLEEPIAVTVKKSEPKQTKPAGTEPEVVPVLVDKEVPVVAAHVSERRVEPLTDAEKQKEALPAEEDAAKAGATEDAKIAESTATSKAPVEDSAPTKTETPTAQPTKGESSQSESDPSETAGPVDLLKDDKQNNPEAVKAAREAAEKQLAIEKLISAGTYVLPINSVEKRRVHRMVAVVLLIVVVLGAAGTLLALDAGYLNIPGFAAPTDLISNK
jgi:hypothetical protein